MDFSFLGLVQVDIFLESLSVKAVIAHIFQPGETSCLFETKDQTNDNPSS